MSIVARLKVLVLSVSLIFIVALSICVYGLINVKSKAEHALMEDAVKLSIAEKMHTTALQTGQATRNIMLSPEDKNAVENYRQALSEFNTNAGLFRKQLGDHAEHKAQHDALIKAWEEDNKLKEQVQQLAASGDLNGAKKLLIEKETPQWRSVKALLLKQIKTQEDALAEKRKDMTGHADLILRIVLVCATFGAVSGLVMFVVIMRTITRRINSAIDGVFAVTNGGGDLTKDLDSSGNDEITRLTKEINVLISWLRDMVRKLSEQGEHVAVKVCEMTKTTKDTVATAATQKESSVAVAVAAEEMASTLNGVADNTHNAAEVASAVNQAASGGMQAVEQACQCMEGIKDSVEITRGTVERLTASSEKIGEIAGMIEDIADQTNLLALNAAIEAARAGENGRGFAVVADEVKNLSAKTAASTREISSIISAIRKEGQQALSAMHDEYSKVVDGVSTAQAARDGLSHILGLAGQSTDMINQIATATEEQSVVTSEITEKIQHISSMAQTVNNEMIVTDKTLLGLSEIAEQIFSTVGCFSVGTYHDEKRTIAQKFRDRVVEALEAALENRAITMEQLFSRNYTRIANTDPPKYSTAYDALFEKVISPIQEDVVASNPDLATATCFDDRAYLPCHLLKFSKPLTGNKEVDMVQNRTKLIFEDRVSVRACKNTDPFLLQTFMRVSGEIIIDLACPIFIRGKHWGAVRVGYSPRG